MQRSIDARLWNAIGTVAATGESESPAAYRFLDSDLPVQSTAGPIYYRLKMIDLDNSFEFSPIRSVSAESGYRHTVEVYPNPASDHLQIRHMDGSSIRSLSLLDVNGKEVARSGGTDKFDIRKVPPGLHFLVVTDRDQSVSRHKILITH